MRRTHSANAPLVPAFLPFLVAGIGIANFSAMDAVMKGQSIALGALAALVWRSVWGVAGSGALFAAARRPWPPRARIVLHVQRSLAAALSILLFFWGLARTPMADAIALTFLAPLAAAFMAALLLGERLRRGALMGSVLAAAGVAVILGGKASDGSGDLAGSAAILAASLLYAYNLVLLRRSALAADPIEITLATNLVMLATFTALGLAALALGLPAPFAWPIASGWWLLPLAAALQIASSMMLAWAYRRAEAQVLAVTEYTAFLWAALLGWLIYGERLTAGTLAGAVLIVAGCLAATRAKPAPMPQTEAAL